MDDKKHIDRLFQERFKDFEATPNDAVWKNIEAELKSKNKKRRVIPIWWRYAGVAALLVLFLAIGFQIFNNENFTPTEIKVVDTEDTKPIAPDIIKDSTASESNIATNKENNNSEKSTNNTKNYLTKDLNAFQSESNTSVAASKTNTAAKSTTEHSKNSAENNSASNQSSTVIASSNNQENNTKRNQKDNVLIESDKAKQIISNASEENSVIAKTDNQTDKTTLTIEEAMAASTENISNVKNKTNRWSVAPNVAPVYFNGLGSGSTIDMQFNNSPKSGELNMSYGINASYAVNEKIKIRSGINKVNLGYNTENVIVFQSVGGNTNSISSLKNTNNTQRDISFIRKEAITSNNTIALNSINTSINQSMGYIEVPLEIEYALVRKKLGINIIGGFSSLFLSNNKIYSEPQNGARTLLGEANNINNLSYSANLGLGLNYQFSKKLNFNLEPIFKYQLNTFNKTYGDFNPYFIGVYTGFAIKF